MRPSSGSIGRALPEAEYPELRMRRLLAARGAALRAQCAEALRWLSARRVERASLGELVAFEVADALGDRPGRGAMVGVIALGYVRGVDAARARRERAA